MKRQLLFAAAVMLLAVCHPPQLSAQTTYDPSAIPQNVAGWQTDTDGSVTGTTGAEYLWINTTNFPDEAFRNQLLTDTHNNKFNDRCTLNGHGKKGYFLKDEITGEALHERVTYITVTDSNVKSLQGIEYFTALTDLSYRALSDYSPAGLTGTLDLSNNKALYLLNIRYNTKLTGINLTGLSKLGVLDITGCYELADNPYLSDCIALKQLSAQLCRKIETLDLTNNKELTYLAAGYNNSPLKEIKGIDNLTNLQTVVLNRSLSLIPFPTFTHCPNLRTLQINQNPQVTQVKKDGMAPDFNAVVNSTDNKKLVTLDCSHCEIPALDVKDYLDLTTLQCAYNRLTELYLPTSGKLTTLNCNDNQLTSLEVTGHTQLTQFYCADNLLTELDVTKNTSLTQFNCQNNKLRTLDLSQQQSTLTAPVGALRIQKSDYDLKVIDHQKIGILLPGCTSADDTPTAKAENFRSNNLDDYGEADGKVKVYDGETTDTRSVSVHTDTDGKQYLIIADAAKPAADEDLYGKHVRYAYKTDNADKYMTQVDIEVYPYIMNLHYNSVTPAEKSYNNVAFHSGTLYLDYDAVVPDGAEAYIITSTQPNNPNDGNVPTADKVNLTLIAKGGTDTDVVPALTPVYVKGADLGWYDFQDAKRIYGEGTYTSRMTADIPEVMTDALIAKHCDVFKTQLHVKMNIQNAVDDEIATLKEEIEKDYQRFYNLEQQIAEVEAWYGYYMTCPDDQEEKELEGWGNEFDDWDFPNMSDEDFENWLEEIQPYFPEVTSKTEFTKEMYIALCKYYNYGWNGTDNFKTMYLKGMWANLAYRASYYDVDYDGQTAPTKDIFIAIMSSGQITTWQAYVDAVYGQYAWVETYGPYTTPDEPTYEEYEIAYLKHYEECDSWEAFRAKRIEHYTNESTITDDDIDEIYELAKKDFYEVYNLDEVKAAIPDAIQQLRTVKDYNILQGVLVDHTIGANQVMTLTREQVKGTGIVGFWRYTGTKIPAHRCYISRAHLSATASASNGANGFEFNFDDDGNATGISTINSEQLTINNDAWYTLDGRKLDGKPTQRGIYIHNGRKEVVK